MIRQVYHHWEKWEETPMWRRTPADERQARFDTARAIVVDRQAFRACLLRAVEEWPISCEHNLTDLTLNRAAWLWHAASYIATGASEEVTRSVWGTLTNEQRRVADAIAWEVVAEWESARMLGGSYSLFDEIP